MDLTADQRRALLDLARESIRSELGEMRASGLCSSDPDDPVLLQPAGCFVTLHTLANHRLRGCVGRLQSQDPLLRVVRESAVSALHDPRFTGTPIRLSELSHLELEITVILPQIAAEGPLDFDPLNDGIHLVVGNRGGCFLPQVARETGWSREELLSRLCTEKLELPAAAWKDPEAKLKKFGTIVVGPEPFVPHLHAAVHS